jgi:hypothetical protein
MLCPQMHLYRTVPVVVDGAVIVVHTLITPVHAPRAMWHHQTVGEEALAHPGAQCARISRAIGSNHVFVGLVVGRAEEEALCNSPLLCQL